MTDEPIDVTVIPFEFASAKAALEVFEDLNRWIHRGDRDLSAYRLAGEDGEPRIIVAVVATITGHVEPVIRRFKRAGGTFRDIPDPDKQALVERTIEAGAQGLDARRSYKIALPLRSLGGDPDLN